MDHSLSMLVATLSFTFGAADPGSSLSTRGRVHLELDHANVAVRDLAASGWVFEQLGFRLKPGSPHANSIANLHAKFLDGTELELITAAEPRDALAEEYRALLVQGDGGAFIALRSREIDSLAVRLRRAGHPAPISRQSGPRSISFPRDSALRSLWFLEVLRPWIDRPEYTQHANTALGLRAVWLAAELEEAALPLFASLGYDSRQRDWPLPGSRIIALASGEIYLVDLAAAPRPLVGVTLEVQSLDAVEEVLRVAGADATRRVDERGTSLLVESVFARGIRLEFLRPLPAASASKGP